MTPMYSVFVGDKEVRRNLPHAQAKEWAEKLETEREAWADVKGLDANAPIRVDTSAGSRK